MFPDCSPCVRAFPYKTCSKCGEVKSIDQYSSNGYGGKLPECKACRSSRAHQYYEEHGDGRREYNREYYQANTERERKRTREYARSHADHIIEYRQINAERLREYAREYNDAHAEHRREYRKVHAEYRREYKKQYHQSEGGKIAIRMAVHRRRARKQSLPDTFTATDWQHALDYFGGCCAACGRPPGLWHTLSADHWIPLSKGGPTTPDNIIPLCHGSGGCNNKKNNRNPANWLTEQFGKRKGRAIQRRIEAYLDSRKPRVEESS